jgi:hypothetical protein
MQLLRSRLGRAVARAGLVAIVIVLAAACGTGQSAGTTGEDEPVPTATTAPSTPGGAQLLNAPRDLTPGVRYLDDRFRVPYAFTPPDPGRLGGPWHGGAGGQQAGEPFSGISLDNAPGYP